MDKYPAKAEKQLYKLAKKGDLNALSALNEYYEKCVTEAGTPKESSRIRRNALLGCVISTGMGQKLIMKKRAAFMGCPQNRDSDLHITGWGSYMNRDLA